MECGICSQQHSSRLPFHCATCARNAIYELRLQHAQVLVEKESLGQQIGTEVKTNLNASEETNQSFKSNGTSLSTFDIEQIYARHAEAQDRTREIELASQEVGDGIKTARETAEELRKALTERREQLQISQRDLEERKSSAYGNINRSIDRARHRWDANHQTIADARSFLSREAASLCGLRQRRRRRPDGSVREDYKLGGVSIVDLRELNSKSCQEIRRMQLIVIDVPPARITTALTNVAHLLVLTSHYLSLRLPAEITLPHRDYPLPTIFPPASSYRSRIVSFPGYANAQSFNSSPSNSKGDIRPMPRPRPLYIDKPLPVLAKEDPAAYALFIEGATYLAWNIAWLCRTQGLDIGSRNWEDACSMGKNLWLLLVGRPGRLLSGLQIAEEMPQASKSGTKEGSRAAPMASLGQFSHGTSHTFLGGSEGNDFMRGWKLSSPMKIVDRVKSNLLGDMAGAEWEVLDERAWEEDEAGIADATAVVEARKKAANQVSTDISDPAEGPLTLDTLGLAASELASTEGPEAQATGKTRGWTKLKSRT